MPNHEEGVIKVFTGTSNQTKPTIAAGFNVPNGSRWREIDTGKTYFFNLNDDRWYEWTTETKQDRFGSVFGHDYQMQDVLEGVLLELKKINLQLSFITDEHIGDYHDD